MDCRGTGREALEGPCARFAAFVVHDQFFGELARWAWRLAVDEVDGEPFGVGDRDHAAAAGYVG